MITPNPFFECSQVSDQWDINKMSCSSSQELSLNHCWFKPFVQFFSPPFSPSCYISNRYKVNIMTGEAIIWPWSDVGDGGQVCPYVWLKGISYCYIIHKIVFICIQIWWEEIDKNCEIFNEKTLTLKILKLI